jgi:GNAT superfamily N-acetyltransferase
MIDTELHFASRFTNMTTEDWGLLFWNEGNKSSHDSNHAIIIDHLGVEATIKQILSFYKGKGITPRIYPSLKDGEYEMLKPHLEAHGFIVEPMETLKYYLHEEESHIMPNPDMEYRRLHSVDPALQDLIIAGGGGDWLIKVAQKQLHHPSYHLIGGFIDYELVCVASVSLFAGYSRLDDVLTHPAHRGKGYSSALIDHLIKYHKSLSDNYLYLYTAAPNAARIYEKGGFKEIPLNFTNFRAYRDL